jgi:long-chain fatty acid transport protein
LTEGTQSRRGAPPRRATGGGAPPAAAPSGPGRTGPPALAGGLLAVALLLLPRTGLAAGFDFYDQGGRATGGAGAFAAQADDPTALFYNPGGLALLPKKKGGAAGLATWAWNESLYQGLPPGDGAGTTGAQKTPLHLAPHAYLLLPLGSRGVFGVGLYSPFLLANDWGGKAAFAGRFLSLRSEITSYDVNPTVAYALTPNLGIGFGLTYRSSKISLLDHMGRVDPSTGAFVDVASRAIDTDFEPGYGWNVGWLHRLGKRFSYALAYRSAVKVDYQGVGRLTQIASGNALLDELVRASLPLDEDLGVTTSMEFPAVATLGVAVGLSEALLAEVDVNWTGWSRIRSLDFSFPSDADLDKSVPLLLDDALSYRLGLCWKTATGTELRLGLAREESPQPDETVGPFLADAGRNVFTAGFGRDWLGMAVVWQTYQQRVIQTSGDDLNGNWRASAWRFVLTAKK